MFLREMEIFSSTADNTHYRIRSKKGIIGYQLLLKGIKLRRKKVSMENFKVSWLDIRMQFSG